MALSYTQRLSKLVEIPYQHQTFEIMGWLLRDNTTTININAKPGDTLRILVENRGRNPAETPDSKGLNVQAKLAWGLRGNGNVTLDGALLQDWFQCGINLTKASVDSLTTTFLEEELVEESVPEKAASQPGFYVGTFTANTLADTFFDSRVPRVNNVNYHPVKKS
uniref:Beta-galactosidase 1-like first all-beta domain-containing protein n=1 Tax=Acrobeloides nanus TaxID=290746 RepID=A0A914CJV0_9BILA